MRSISCEEKQFSNFNMSSTVACKVEQQPNNLVDQLLFQSNEEAVPKEEKETCLETVVESVLTRLVDEVVACLDESSESNIEFVEVESFTPNEDYLKPSDEVCNLENEEFTPTTTLTTTVTMMTNEERDEEDKTLATKDTSNVQSESKSEERAEGGGRGEVNKKSSSRLKRDSSDLENPVPIQVIDFQTEWSLLTDSEKTLGLLAPKWLPDTESDVCMKCDARFTFRKRRHHCRACGLIFCSACCSDKLQLPYKINKNNNSSQISDLSFDDTNSDAVTSAANRKEASRVCTICFDTINRGNKNKYKQKRRAI
jgi:hypothetical protein